MHRLCHTEQNLGFNQLFQGNSAEAPLLTMSKAPCFLSFSPGGALQRPRLCKRLGGVALEIFVYPVPKVAHGASAAGACTANSVYFFGRQLARAHTIQYTIRNDLLLQKVSTFSLNQWAINSKEEPFPVSMGWTGFLKIFNASSGSDSTKMIFSPEMV